jgi:hypothetical protein
MTEASAYTGSISSSKLVVCLILPTPPLCSQGWIERSVAQWQFGGRIATSLNIARRSARSTFRTTRKVPKKRRGRRQDVCLVVNDLSFELLPVRAGATHVEPFFLCESGRENVCGKVSPRVFCVRLEHSMKFTPGLSYTSLPASSAAFQVALEQRPIASRCYSLATRFNLKPSTRHGLCSKPYASICTSMVPGSSSLNTTDPDRV